MITGKLVPAPEHSILSLALCPTASGQARRPGPTLRDRLADPCGRSAVRLRRPPSAGESRQTKPHPVAAVAQEQDEGLADLFIRLVQRYGNDRGGARRVAGFCLLSLPSPSMFC
jgi:hypothetical protein